MKGLLRLYPRSWRQRYGSEMEVLVEEMPTRLDVAFDLLIGAAVAYRDVIRGDRILSAAGAYLHGVTVAVLVQAIAFVTLILIGQGSPNPTDLRVGPFAFASVVGFTWSGAWLHTLQAAIWVSTARSLLPEVAVLGLLILALATVLATPRLLRSLR